MTVGSLYVVSVGAVRDVAGNFVAPIGSWVATDRPAPEITLQAKPAVVDRGATTLLSGRLTAPTGIASLTLEARPVGALQTVALGSVPVAADGSFSARVTPSSTTEYRFRVPAASSYGAGSANAVVLGPARGPAQLVIDAARRARRNPRLDRRDREPRRGRRRGRLPPGALERRLALVAPRRDAQPSHGHHRTRERRLDADGERAVPLAGDGRVDARLSRRAPAPGCAGRSSRRSAAARLGGSARRRGRGVGPRAERARAVRHWPGCGRASTMPGVWRLDGCAHTGPTGGREPTRPQGRRGEQRR